MGNNGKKKKRILQPQDIVKAFYILLKKVGPFTFPGELLDEIPDDTNLIRTVQNDDLDTITIGPKPEKRKRGIIKPPSKIIRP